MAEISVTLRIVGIYFNRTIKFEAGDQPTIKTLLEAAKEQFPLGSENGFYYETDPNFPRSIKLFAHNFSGFYDYNGDGAISPTEGNTLSGTQGAKGLYVLEEQKIYGGVLGWQSYIIRNGQHFGKTKVAGGFSYFAQREIQNNDEVIWRLVAIGKKGSETLA